MKSIQTKIRTLFALTLTMATFIASTQCDARGFMSNKIDVVIKVQDESGKPIPYVTVWQYIQADPKHIQERESHLEMEDLWRVTMRYISTA